MSPNNPLQDKSYPDGIQVIDDRVVFLSGQKDLDIEGRVQNPGDLATQTAAVVLNLETRLQQVESRLSDLVKLVVYYVQNSVDEREFREYLGGCLGPNVQTAVTFVPLRKLSLSDSLVEIEAIAIRGVGAREVVDHADLAASGTGFCHGISCGEFSFVSGQSASSRGADILYPGDLVSQNLKTIDNLQRVLLLLNVDSKNIVKVNSWRATTRDYSAYEQAARDRFEFLAPAGPAVTGITIPRLEAIGHGIRLDLWAMDSKLPRSRINPLNHWGWKLSTSYSHGLQVGRWLFIGGQAALDQNCVVQHPEDVQAQIEMTREYIDSLLCSADGKHDVVKLNSLYCDSAQGDSSPQILRSLNGLYKNFNPVRNQVPVDHLAYTKQAVEIDVIATNRLRYP